MKKFILFFVVLLISLVSCKEQATNTIDTTYIIPLKVGNIWYYKYFVYDSIGEVKNVYNDTIAITKDSMINGKHIYYMRETLSANKLIYNRWLINQDDGTYSWRTHNGKDTFIIYLKYPAKIGDFFTHPNEMTVIDSIQTPYQVPAGSFDCYKYNYLPDYGGELFFSYYSPGVGLIAKENYYRNIINIKKVLINFHLN
jgi:hypothetical protein